MSEAFLTYAVIVLFATGLTGMLIGRKMLTLSNFPGWYLLIFILTYIVRPALAEWAQDDTIFGVLSIVTIDKQLWQMTAAVSCAILSLGIAYRVTSDRSGNVLSAGLETDPIVRSRYIQFAWILCAWAYASILLGGGIDGGGQNSGNDAVRQYGVAEGSTFWLMSSDQFVSSATLMIYILTRRLWLSILVALPWLYLRLAHGFGRHVVIGHFMALIAIWAIRSAFR